MALFATAGMVVAQNADQNTGGPTKNTLQLRLIEPAEGATITGNSVRVTVDYNHKSFGADQGTRFGDSNFPQARFDVYLDNSLKTSLKGTESNTVTIDSVPAGTHKIAVVAINVSGEMIDRKEVNVTTSPAVVAESTTSSSSLAAAPAPVPPAPAPAPAQSTYAPPAPSASYQPAPAPPAPMESTLPTTASSAPQLALLGLALAAGGLLVGRKVR
jgi:LPXTG-motif cell wall-anchored protein